MNASNSVNRMTVTRIDQEGFNPIAISHMGVEITADWYKHDDGRWILQVVDASRQTIADTTSEITLVPALGIFFPGLPHNDLASLAFLVWTAAKDCQARIQRHKAPADFASL